MNVRNAGQGIAIIHGWYLVTGTDHDWSFGEPMGRADQHHAPVEDFRSHGRDMYVPGGDNSFWQGAIREPRDPARDVVAKQLAGADSVTLDVLYGDFEGGQRTVTRFVLTPMRDSPAHLLAATRHWVVDGRQPR